jgi:hypothetical protein
MNRADDDGGGAARIEEWRMIPAGNDAVGAPPAPLGAPPSRARRGGRSDEEDRRL